MPGLLKDSAASILRQLLIDLGQGADDTVGPGPWMWPVKAALLVDTPDNVITCYGTSGLVKGRSMPDGEYQDRPGWQVAIRADDHEAGDSKLTAIMIALDEQVKSNVVYVGQNRYIVYVVSRSGTPMYAGKEPGTHRFFFTLNGVMNVRLQNPVPLAKGARTWRPRR
jgi:hypothetical protein